jgi:hypothetical protein
LLDRAAQLYVDTYWKDGYRSLVSEGSGDGKNVVEALRAAGVLVPVGARSAPGESSPQLRFFHDSMQSYLTARGLFAKGMWDALPRAAGFPKFIEVRQGRAASELLEMCVHVFGPQERLRDVMRERVESPGLQILIGSGSKRATSCVHSTRRSVP